MPKARNLTNDALPVPEVDDGTKIEIAKRDLESASKKMKRQLMKEPMVKVNGNPMYRPFLGKEYTYMFNDISVTIKFDGNDYFYPKSIANNLNQKLAKIAVSNTPTDINEKI